MHKIVYAGRRDEPRRYEFGRGYTLDRHRMLIDKAKNGLRDE